MSPSPPSSKPRAFKTYSEAVRAFADNAVREDVTDACGYLGQGLATMMERFAVVAKQMHTIDMQRVSASSSPPLKPKWDVLARDFGEVLLHCRSNAALISARLKLFSDSVLPVAARNIGGRSQRGYQETIQVLQSFMTISAEHAASTRALIERALSVVQQMVAFHTDIAKYLTRRLTEGQKEVYDVAVKLSELEGQIRQLCSLNTDHPRPDVTHVAFTVFKVVSSTGKRPSRSRLPQQRKVMSENMLKLTQAYRALEVKRDEFAHAQYACQIRMQQDDCLAMAQSSLASLACDAILSLESSFALFLSIWLRLRSDCNEILQWIHSTTPAEPPLALIGFQECGPALYTTLALGLDSCVSSIDLSSSSKSSSS